MRNPSAGLLVVAFALSAGLAAAQPRSDTKAAAVAKPAAAAVKTCPAFLNQDFRKLRSRDTVNLCRDFPGKALLIVNTASHCGYTSQFKGLQALHERYRDKGLVVVGFPSDDFRQEANDEAETAEVCFVNYGVTFTMLSPTVVTGRDANPVFAELARQQREPRWNFSKYLVSPDGRVAAYFGSSTAPDSPQLEEAIGALLR